MNFAAAVPFDFFDERGLPKEYNLPPVQQQIGSMNILRKVPNNAVYISEDGAEIQSKTSTSVSDPVPDPVPSPDFPFLEFLLTEVVHQSQIDSFSISDMLDPRETDISTSSSYNMDFQGKSQELAASHEEMREIRDLTLSAKHTQSTRDSSTISISDNSTTRKSIPGTKDGNPTALQVETDISFNTEGEMQNPETQSSNNRSVMPTDVQALTVLQDLLSDDFQAKNTHSTQRKGEDEKDEAFQLIQKIHN